MDWLRILASAVVAYVLGSIPTGYLIGRIHRIDIRHFGSGRTGGTNVLRTLGWVPALLTGGLDILKGAAAVWAARMIGAPALGLAIAALCSVIGHNYTFTLKFKGGAGVATMVGATAVLSPPTMAVAAPIGIAVAAVWRYASLGSLTLAAILPIGTGLQVACGKLPLVVFLASLAMSAIVVWAHRPNMRRLLAGTERKIGQRVSTDSKEKPPSNVRKSSKVPEPPVKRPV